MTKQPLVATAPVLTRRQKTNVHDMSQTNSTKKQEVTTIADPTEQEEEFYQVESILEKKRIGKRTMYLVKWEGYTV